MKQAPLDGRVRRRDDPQLPARQGLPARAAALARALDLDARPGRTHQRLVHELRDEGLAISGRQEAHADPAGLDLGAEGPEEIAAAIVAEIGAQARA